MSYSSCSNTALYRPNEYIEGAIGSSIVPVLDTGVPVASGVFIDLWNTFVPTKGVYLISGCVRCDATAGDITSVLYQVEIDTANVVRYSMGSGAEPTMWISFSAVFVADGVKALSCALTATTSGGATWEVDTGANSLVSITRIA